MDGKSWAGTVEDDHVLQNFTANLCKTGFFEDV